MLGSIASAINSQHGRGKHNVSAYEAAYGQQMDHDFSFSKEEAQRCWTVPERIKVTNDPQFAEYAPENYIIDNDEICDDDEIGDDDAKGYFLDGSLPSDEKEEVSNEYFLIICRMTSLRTTLWRSRDYRPPMHLMRKAMIPMLILSAMLLG